MTKKEEKEKEEKVKEKKRKEKKRKKKRKEKKRKENNDNKTMHQQLSRLLSALRRSGSNGTLEKDYSDAWIAPSSFEMDIKFGIKVPVFFPCC